jgi:hypothetical protein
MGSPWPGNVRFSDFGPRERSRGCHRTPRSAAPASSRSPRPQRAGYRPAAIGAIKRCFTERASSIHRTPGHPRHPPGSLQEPGEPGCAADKGGDVVRMSAIGEGMPLRRPRFDPKPAVHCETSVQRSTSSVQLSRLINARSITRSLRRHERTGRAAPRCPAPSRSSD